MALIISSLLELADELINFFKKQYGVQDSFLRGSLVTEKWDDNSDIDIDINVFGVDNGQFAK
ncbi:MULTISPECIES: nucleotidyltransferase domain-containing protein [Oceanobacillus]|uniref:Polymerase nucleotidyl transferase domain-containing protein n=1 Tax=Oceanobacillus neutriphilus TaxID=531815 RepID=A0ABQ2NW10_9BACI|nr:MULTISPECIES: nucleotidyltransferase domain-containing protein [Oceanobacillus]MCT1904589.1 hypothetical protein [Oceanobacillus sojae]GGP11920.1 hypothetical protein GCM10011346_25850 [Oceanobacillus neutriphilus]